MFARRFSLAPCHVSQRSSVHDKKAKLSALQNQLKESEDKLMDAQKVYTPHCHLRVFRQHLQRMMTAEEKAGQLEKICQAEESRNTAIIKELNALREVQHKQSERVFSLKQQDQTVQTAAQCMTVMFSCVTLTFPSHTGRRQECQ